MISNKHALAAIRFQWLGTASLILDFDGYRIAVDPFVSRPSILKILRKQMVSKEDQVRSVFVECQNVVVSHAHHDHVMDVPIILQNTATQMYGSSNACQLVMACGADARQVHQIKPQDQFNLGPVRVEVNQGRHIHLPLPIFGELPAEIQQPVRLRDYKMDDILSFVFEFEGVRLAIQPFNETQADILFIMPYHGRVLRKLIALEKPACVIPIHWDNFFKPLENHDGPMERLMRRRLTRLNRWLADRAPSTRFLLPEIGRTYHLKELIETEAKETEH